MAILSVSGTLLDGDDDDVDLWNNNDSLIILL